MTVQPAGTLRYRNPATGQWTPMGIPAHIHPGTARIVGEIIIWAGNTAPAGWMTCDGSSVTIAAYPGLFAALGYIWGGSGENFTLPDMRGNCPVGIGGVGVIGTKGGAAFHAHATVERIGGSNAHTHTVNTPSTVSSSAGSHSHGTGGPSGVVYGASGVAMFIVDPNHTHNTGTNGSHTHTVDPATLTSSSVSHAHIMPTTPTNGISSYQPYAVVNFIIFVG